METTYEIELDTKVSSDTSKASVLDFKPITHADMPLIWEFLSREEGRTTDFSYGGLFMWVDYFDYQYAIYKDTLFIKGLVENDRTKPAFSLPIGSLPLEDSMKILKAYCESHNMPVVLSAVPEYAVDELHDLGAYYVELLEDWSDYLYDAEMLSSLKGKKMSKKRNHINSFETHNPEWTFTPLNASNIPAVLKFMDIYDNELDEALMGKVESRLARKMIKIMEEGDPVMVGGVLYSSPGKICAFTIGDVKGDTLYVHIEKATREVNGSYEMINHLFAQYICKNFPQVKFINREDDGGDEGLKRAKESYHPVALLRKYNLIF